MLLTYATDVYFQWVRPLVVNNKLVANTYWGDVSATTKILPFKTDKNIQTTTRFLNDVCVVINAACECLKTHLELLTTNNVSF